MIRIQLVVVSALLCVAACSEEGGSGASATAVSVAGRLSSAPAEASDAAVIWSVTSGSDYLYVWGRAEVSGVAFQLELRGRPPAEAINSYGLGVGLILIAPRSLLHDGKQTDVDMTMYKRVSGASERHAIIYVDHDQANAEIEARAPTATPEQVQHAREHWLWDFPSGYSCGAGTDPKAGSTFEGYTPVDCAEVQMRAGELDEMDFPNWT